VPNVLPICDVLGEYDFFDVIRKFAFRVLVVDVPSGLILEVGLHLGHIDYAPLRHLLELLIVDISPVKCQQVSVCQFLGRESMKWSCVVAEVNLTSDSTPSLAAMMEWTLMPPFFLPVLGLRPAPLKIALEKSVTVVESIICSRFSHVDSQL